MTIEKGQSWGEPAAVDAELPTAIDDADLARLAMAAYDRGDQVTAKVANGDLLNTLGISESRPAEEQYAYPIDLGLATFDPESGNNGPPIPFVAHVTICPRDLPGAAVIRTILGHGPPIAVAVMNGAWFGELRLGPRAHPNDGRLDVIEGRVSFRERREANRRARSGSHLPHPELRTSRTTSWQSRFDRPMSVLVDGVPHGTVSSISVDLVPDALTVVA